MQACSTTENTPAGYNTHAITLNSDEAPVWHGFHTERENKTGAESIRQDLMGFLPSELRIRCGLDQWSALQTITIPFAYTQHICDDIAAQTKRPKGTTGTIWKTAPMLAESDGTGLLGHSQDVFTYNANAVEVYVRNVEIILKRNYMFIGLDSNGYFRQGFMKEFNYEIHLDIVPKGDMLYTLNKTDKDSYAGDLDLSVNFVADATNDKIPIVFDKLYMKPFDEKSPRAFDRWTEGYRITLEPLDTTSSVTCTSIDGLNNNHYENP